jgi:hypothetical protein
MRKFPRTATDPAAQDETLCEVQVKTVGIFAWRYVAVVHIFVLSVQWFNARAVGKLVTPSTLQVIVTSLVTPCKFDHRPRRGARATHLLFKVSLGNAQEMRAFYVPELNSNALRVAESEGDPSIAVNQLMEAAERAQAVRKILVTQDLILTYRSSPVFAISMGMVPGAATNEVNSPSL